MDAEGRLPVHPRLREAGRCADREPTGVLTENPMDEAIAGIDYPSAESAHASMQRRRSPAGTLGVLEELSAWTAGVQASDPPRPFRRVRLVGFGAQPGPVVRALAEAAEVGIINP